MPIEFDPEKSRRNVGRGRITFEEADAFEFETAIVREDRRFAYPERRFQAIGRMGAIVAFLVFTPIPGGFRVISLRKANRKERRTWSENLPPT